MGALVLNSSAAQNSHTTHKINGGVIILGFILTLDSLVLCGGKATHLETAKIFNKTYFVKMVEADKQQRMTAPSASYSSGKC